MLKNMSILYSFKGVKSMNSKGISLLLAMTLTISGNIYGAVAPEKIYSKGSILIEKDSKRILYEKNGKEALPMASTTKIMTCIVALENANLDDIVTVSSRAAKAPKVKLDLRQGEKQRLGDLLYSLMLESHNDTAVAIAEHVGGSVEDFCKMMTEKAKEIGAEGANFETPNGLDGPNHHASAYDMAIIAAYAIDNPKFIEITNTPNIHIPTQKVEGGRPHDLQNKNRFLSSYQGAIGVKTGFTSKAGHCFVGAVDKENMQLVGVALGAGWDSNGKARKYTDVIKLMNYGFNNYDKYKVLDEADCTKTIPIEKGKEQVAELYGDERIILPLTKEEAEKVQLKVTLPSVIMAPVEKGQVVGRIDVVCEDTILGSAQLMATKTINKATWLDLVKRYFRDKF